MQAKYSVYQASCLPITRNQAPEQYKVRSHPTTLTPHLHNPGHLPPPESPTPNPRPLLSWTKVDTGFSIGFWMWRCDFFAFPAPTVIFDLDSAPAAEMG